MGRNPRGSSVGEIVQVQGGHIIRATGLKDRHSKVFTAKGPRDRRVRLSAHTAIQFYDVQDRLGYDRPSKAVDWLMQKAKDSIDKLPELPPWDPHTGVSSEHGQVRVGGSMWENPSMNFQNYPQENQHYLSQSGGSVGFDESPSNHMDLGRVNRLMGWSGGSNQFVQPQEVAYNFQRGTLQSSSLFSHPNLVQQSNHSLISGMGLGSEGGGGFMGFSIPSQLHNGGSNTNASSSSLSPNSSSPH